MVYSGIIQNGVVVLPEGVELPDGTVVTVAIEARAREESLGKRLESLGKWSESQTTDLPADLALNHDHYLHGGPKP